MDPPTKKLKTEKEDQHVEKKKNEPKNDENLFLTKNKNLGTIDIDYFYHFGIDTSMDLQAMFGDTKFVCMGGTPERMLQIAEMIRDSIPQIKNLDPPLTPIGKTERYQLLKAGPVISVNHGIGIPSFSIAFQEICKILYYAKAKNFVFFRIGTCGGLGLKPGSVVISSQSLNTKLKPEYKMRVLGEKKVYPTFLNAELNSELIKHHGTYKYERDFDVVLGKTLCANDFYEEQGRVDGFFCDHTEEDKMKFLKKCASEGVSNIEMESLGFAGMCARAGIPGAVVCATMLDRLQGDQVTLPGAILNSLTKRASSIVIDYIATKLALQH